MTDPRTIAELEALDDRRAAAAIAKDRATLEALLADDLRYVHSSATVEDKATYIERVCTGWYDYKSLDTRSREWRLYGDVALCNGEVRIQVVAKGAAKDFVSRYLQVWRREPQGWRMASWQSTLVPAA
ncbi:MAG: nuclear transport factor 2 family protein [Burkholderiales bacterium]|jgi:ketosteroid isomerase-like protein